ncbi:tRNA pseudouridine synthase TruA family protein [Streptobacillus canis]|uniref:pseudouridylate synthase n=1 Tax=Streptobacillus canis TaxID=2678686 RepID=UPI0012E29E34|nr:pseudouridylate synthase [Streptobacillus canis]
MENRKTGYLLEISYKGKKFDCFDEMKDKKTVKGVLKDYLLSKGIKIIKGLQQAGRTDARVSAYSNYIYFMAEEFNVDCIDIEVDIEGLKIKSILKTKNNLVLPELVKRRIYIYYYPKKFLNIDEEIILKRCEEVSGYKDFSEFTNHKGLKLKNHFRDVQVTYNDEKLYFDGDSFMPQQVRRMSGYILKGKKEPMDPKFLILDKIIFEGDVF